MIQTHYTIAIEELKKVKLNYPKPEQHPDLYSYAELVIKNYGDQTALQTFRNQTMSNSMVYLDRQRMVKKAIDLAIRDFEIQHQKEELTKAQHRAHNPQVQAKPQISGFKLELYLLIYVLLVITLILFQNFETVKTIQITPIQIIIVIGLPILLILGHFFPFKIPERWFAVGLVIFALVLERLFNIFKILQ